MTGFQTLKDDQLLTPLVYSTEIARSILLGAIERVAVKGGATLAGPALEDLTAQIEVHKSGDLCPTTLQRSLGRRSHRVAGLVYGLVNMRCDGNAVMCATLKEGDGSWTRKTFKTRF